MVSPAATIGIVGAIIILGVLLTFLSKKTRSPLIILLLLLGIVLGPVTKLFTPADFGGIINAVVTFALVVILFDVGYGISLKGIARKIETSAGLAFTGVIITIIAVFLFSRYILGLDWLLSILLGALVASTDLTVVFPALENIKIPQFIKDNIDLEATMNSIPAVIIAIVVVNIMDIGMTTFDLTLKMFLYNVFVGFGIGAILGYFILRIIQKLSPEEKPHIISLGAVFLVFALTELVGASGIAAALVVGIIFGNSKPALPRIVHSFGGEMQLLLVTFVYIILGAMLSFSIFMSSGITIPIIMAIFVGIIFIARYLSIRIGSFKAGPALRKVYLVSGPRGIVCAVLALSYAWRFPNPELIVGLIFSTILISSFAVFLLPGFAKKLPRKLKR
jgi:NhaP-type Na+/H+ or K+/H+ antiporter